MQGGVVHLLQALSIGAIFFCLLNILTPMKRLGIKSRKAAAGLLLLAFTVAVGLSGLNETPSPAPSPTQRPAVQPAPAPAAQPASAPQPKSKPMSPDDAFLAMAKDPDKRDAWVAKAQDAVMARLKDPSSAEFRNAFFHLAKLNGHYAPMSCGEVNSKNGFGGYNGYQRYISAGDENLTFLEEEVADFSKAWKLMCED